MYKDPIVEEVRRVRQDHAARFNYDLKAIIQDLREKQEKSGRRYLRLPARKLEKTPR